MIKKDLILIRIINSIEYSPLSRSVKFAEIIKLMPNDKKEKLLEQFANFLCTEFLNQIKKSITTQKFKVSFKPLSPKYIEYKKRQKLEEGFWKSTGFLLDHLKVWKYDNEYRIGFPLNLSYPESNIKVLQIAKTLEFGSKSRNIPARPVFTPIARYISKNISFFLNKYLDTVNFKTF